MKKRRLSRAKPKPVKAKSSLHELPEHWGDKSRPAYSWDAYRTYIAGHSDMYGRAK